MSKEVSKAKARKNGIIEFAVGAGVAALGGIMSYVSYNNAGPGETYTVYTGFIALGIVYAVKGLIDIAFPNAFKKNKKAEEEPEKATADAEVIKEED